MEILGGIAAFEGYKRPWVDIFFKCLKDRDSNYESSEIYRLI